MVGAICCAVARFWITRYVVGAECSALCEAASYLALFVAGTGLLGLTSWRLARLEGLRRPIVWDHLRHCALLYLVLLFLGVLAVAWFGSEDFEDTSGAYVSVIIGFLLFGYGTSADAVVLALVRWRWRRRSASEPIQRPGGSAS